jgi:hypothetical protein
MRKEYPTTLELVESMVQPGDVKRYTSDYTAIVDSGPGAKAAGGSALAVSTVPLRTVSASGERKPLDLSLRDQGGGLEPANPLVGFKLPGDLGSGIALPGGVRVSIASGDPKGVGPSRLGSSTALYPEVAADTDLLASARPGGVELFRLLRSPRSPEREVLRVDLPKGTALEATRDGGAQVVRGTKPVLSIARPTASDAQGASVPVRMQVAGDRLSVTVARGRGNWAYPILVDPAIDSYWWTNYASDFNGWLSYNNGNYSLNSDCMFGRTCFGHGLNIYAWAGQWYAANTVGGFQYRAPADRSSFIARATLGSVTYATGEGPSSPYFLAELWDSNPSHGINDFRPVYEFMFNGTIDLTRIGDSPTVKELNVELTNTWDHVLRGDRHAYIGAATIYLDDTESPTFANISRPPWVDTEPATIPLAVAEGGLGIGTITVSKAGGPSWQTALGCNGGNRSPCPRTWESPANGTVNYDPSVLPQGVNNLSVSATDAGGKVSQAGTTQVRVDHTAPTLKLSGSLVDAGQPGGGG